MRTACCAAAAALVLATSCAHVQPGSTAQNMTLLAHQDLQGRSAYQPVIKESHGRWIARTAPVVRLIFFRTLMPPTSRRSRCTGGAAGPSPRSRRA